MKTIQYSSRGRIGLLAILAAVVLFAATGSSNSALGQDYAAKVIADGPVAYYRFEEDPIFDPLALDSSGNGFDGTWEGAVDTVPDSASPDLGRAVRFDGIDSFVSTGQPLLDGLGAFSLSYFVRPAVVQSNRTGIIGQNDAIEYGFINGTTIQIWTPGGGSLNTPYNFPVDTWHHIVSTGDGNNLRTYYDGKLVGTGGGATGNYGNSDFDVNIGGGGVFDGTGNFFEGDIDEVAIFDYALSDEQILQQFLGSGLAPPPDPAGRVNANLSGGQIVGAAYGLQLADNSVEGPVDWKLQKRVQEPIPVQDGLVAEWWTGVGNINPKDAVDAFATANPADLTFVVPDPNFGGPVGFPQEIIDAGFPANDRMVRFTGEIFIPEGGTYNFKDGIDQYTYLRIGDQVIIDDNQWAGFDGSGGDNGGSEISQADFVFIDPDGEWFEFEFIMSEDCCGDQSSLYWDYDPLGPEGQRLNENFDFPLSNTEPAGLDALIPPEFFRTPEGAVRESLELLAEGTGLVGDDLTDAEFGVTGQDGDIVLLTVTVPSTGDTIVVEQTLVGGGPNPDFDGSGTVDAPDFRMLAAAYGSTDAAFDLSGDGNVGVADVSTFQQSFGQTVASPAAVPEPSTCVLCLLAMAIGAMGYLRRRRN